MTERTCTTCRFHSISRVYRDDGACYRAKKLISGRTLRPPADGFPWPFERGHIDIYEGRLESDHCGPAGVHWEAKK